MRDALRNMFFCCVPLLPATLIIGYLAILECLVIAVKCFIGEDREVITLITITPECPPDTVTCGGLSAFCICRGVFNLFLCLLCVRLLIGAYKGIPKYFEIWLIVYLFVNILDLLLIVTALIWIGGMYLFFYFVIIMIRFYFIYIVNRYYRMLMDCGCDYEVANCECGEVNCCECAGSPLMRSLSGVSHGSCGR